MERRKIEMVDNMGPPETGSQSIERISRSFGYNPESSILFRATK